MASTFLQASVRSRAWLILAAFASTIVTTTTRAEEKATLKPRKVKARVQAQPGKPPRDVDMTVHPVAVDLPTVSADKAPIQDDELVLGVVVEGQAVAYPIRFLAIYGVINARVGETPIAPSW